MTNRIAHFALLFVLTMVLGGANAHAQSRTTPHPDPAVEAELEAVFGPVKTKKKGFRPFQWIKDNWCEETNSWGKCKPPVHTGIHNFGVLPCEPHPGHRRSAATAGTNTHKWLAEWEMLTGTGRCGDPDHPNADPNVEFRLGAKGYTVPADEEEPPTDAERAVRGLK